MMIKVCPNCGAPVHIKSKKSCCDYCGTAMTLSDIELRTLEDEAPKACAEAEAPAAMAESAEPAAEKKRKTWLWVLGWIFIFPVPVTIIVVKSKKLPKVAKAVIIVAVWLFYMALGTAGES